MRVDRAERAGVGEVVAVVVPLIAHAVIDQAQVVRRRAAAENGRPRRAAALGRGEVRIGRIEVVDKCALGGRGGQHHGNHRQGLCGWVHTLSPFALGFQSRCSRRPD